MGELKLVRRQRERLGDQLRGQILEQIVFGGLEEGDKLLSENQICRAFRVSCPAVRAAAYGASYEVETEVLMRLHVDGLVAMRHGSGTFVQKWHSDRHCQVDGRPSERPVCAKLSGCCPTSPPIPTIVFQRRSSATRCGSRTEAAPAPAEAGRYLAPRRGLPAHEWPAALSLARGGPARRRVRHPRGGPAERDHGKRFFKRLLAGLKYKPRRIVTDGLRSYGAARREVLPDVRRWTSRYMNNRAENSHRPTRRRERQMQRFKSPRQAQLFLSSHAMIYSRFRPRRHLMTADQYCRAREEAFQTWRQETCAQLAA